MEDGEIADEDNLSPYDPDKLSVLENAMRRLKVLAQSVLNEEDRLKLWSKFYDNMNLSLKETQEIQTHQAIHHVDEHEGRELSNEARGAVLAANAEGEYPNEMLLSFLDNAVERGGIELKDLSTVLNCIHEASQSKEDRASKDSKNPLDVPQGINVSEHWSLLGLERDVVTKGKVTGDACKMVISKGSDQLQGPADLRPVVINKDGLYPAVCKCHYPSDNKEIVSPKTATVPRSEYGEKMSQKLMKDSVKGTAHVLYSKPPYSLADFQFHGLKYNSKGKENVDPSGKCSKDHSFFAVNKEKRLPWLEKAEGFLRNVAVKSGKEDNPTRSYADILKNGQNNPSTQDCKVSLSDNAVFSSDESSVLKLHPEVLERRLQECKFSIVGRLLLAKGDAPWPQKKLKERLHEIWNITSDWKCVSLGKGFFHLLFKSREEWEKVWLKGPIFLKPGVMRLQRWTVDFDPSKDKSSYAQVWCRFYHLPWGLWEPSVIAGIAHKVGVPIRFDKATFEGEFGHYARALVDVDVSKSFKSIVHLECGKHMFEVKIIPESLPSFCHGCSSIGHNSNVCRTLDKRNDNPKPSKGPNGGETNGFGTSNVPNGSHSRDKDAGLIKSKSLEWIKKKDKDNGTGSSIKEGNSNKCINAPCVVETITDFGSQFEAPIIKKKDSDDLFLCNHFSVLEVDVDNLISMDSHKDSRLGVLDNMMKEDRTEFSVQPGNVIISNTFSPSVEITSSLDCNEETMIDDNGEMDLPKLSPHVKEKWSNIIDEEEDVVIAPVPFDGLILPPSCLTEVDYTTREALISRSFGSTSTTPLYGQWLQAAKKKSKKGKTGFKHKPVRNV